MSRRETFRFEKPIGANYDTPAGVSCVEIKIPDAYDHLAILQGLVASLAKPEFWDGTEAIQAQMSYLWEVAYEATDWSNCVQPETTGAQDNITLLHIFSEKTAGAAFIYNKGTNNGGVTFQNPPALNDAFEVNYIRLRVGTWQIRVFGSKNSQGGTMNLWLQPEPSGSTIPILTCNFYNATTLENQTFSNTSVTVPDDGIYSLQGQTIAPTSPSVGYLCQITAFNLQRVGD